MKYQMRWADVKNHEWVSVWKEAVMVYFRPRSEPYIFQILEQSFLLAKPASLKICDKV
jgi:hypothetical protein